MYDIMNSEALPREVEFVMNSGEKTGFFLSLRHESCKEAKAVERRYTAKFTEAARGRRGKTSTDNIAAEFTEERRLSLIAGWRFAEDSIIHINHEYPEFTKENAKAILSAPGIIPQQIVQFIDDEVGDATAFLESVESN